MGLRSGYFPEWNTMRLTFTINSGISGATSSLPYMTLALPYQGQAASNAGLRGSAADDEGTKSNTGIIIGVIVAVVIVLAIIAFVVMRSKSSGTVAQPTNMDSGKDYRPMTGV
jgi:hypothetical protein